MNFKDFILNMVSTLESTVNSKIVGGFISLFATIGFGSFNLMGPMGIMGGLVVAFFGLSSFDYKATTFKTTGDADKKISEKKTIETNN